MKTQKELEEKWENVLNVEMGAALNLDLNGMLMESLCTVVLAKIMDGW
jgi:hypothetical protein